MELTPLPPSIRWDNPDDFAVTDAWCDPTIMRASLASCVIFTASNVHDFIMSFECSKWMKISALIVLDTALVLTAPLLALAETILRITLALLTSPLLLAKPCSEEEWLDLPLRMGDSAIFSLAQVPNTFYTIYQTFTSPARFSPDSSGNDIATAMSCNTITFNYLSYT